VGLLHIAGVGGMAVAATDRTGEVRAVERPDHPFFVATLYQPQLRSAPGAPHPVFTGLLAAAGRGPTWGKRRQGPTSSARPKQ
jgi:CTP synthase (UTP-ammonia lyase)